MGLGIGCEKSRLAPQMFAGRNFWFFGNSVTRHYAFALAGWLEGQGRGLDWPPLMPHTVTESPEIYKLPIF